MLVARTLAGPILPNPISACGVTVVITGGVTLFVEFGSVVGEVTVAEFVSVPIAGAVIVSVTLVVAPLSSVPKLQFTVPLLFTPLPLAETNVTPAGKLSVTTTLLAADGPKLVIEIV